LSMCFTCFGSTIVNVLYLYRAQLLLMCFTCFGSSIVNVLYLFQLKYY